MDKRECYRTHRGDSDFSLPSPIRDSLVEGGSGSGLRQYIESLNDLIVARADSLYDWKIEKIGLFICPALFSD